MVGSSACPLGVDANMTHAEDSTNTAIFAARLMKGMSIVETRFRKTGWAGRRDRPLLLLHLVVHLLPGLLAPLHSHRLLRMEASSEFGGAWQQPACAAGALVLLVWPSVPRAQPATKTRHTRATTMGDPRRDINRKPLLARYGESVRSSKLLVSEKLEHRGGKMFDAARLLCIAQAGQYAPMR